MTDLFNLKGKVALVTGASSGLGVQFAKALAGQGADIVISARRLEKLEAVKKEIEALGVKCFAVKCDVTDNQQVIDMVKAVEAEFGKIDILVNNAGYGLFGCTELLPTDEVKRQLYTNFMGMYMMTKHAISNMCSGAKIVNISSTCALFPLPYRNIYCASKSAVSSFSDCLKMELKPLGIDITSICPGEIKTPFTMPQLSLTIFGSLPKKLMRSDSHFSVCSMLSL